MIKTLAFVLVIATIILPSSVQADVVVPGQKFVSYCVQIENISEYPDYVFMLYPLIVGEVFVTLHQDECVSFYKLSQPSIYAIKKADFNKQQLVTDYEKNLTPKNLIASGINVEYYAEDVSENDPLEEVQDVFRIESISDTELKLVPKEVLYVYDDETTEIKSFTGATTNAQSSGVTYDRSEPSRTAILSWWAERFWYISIPSIGLMGIIIVVVHKYIKRPKKPSA